MVVVLTFTGLKVGLLWLLATTVGVPVGLLCGAWLNDNLWTLPTLPPGVEDIWVVIDNPLQRMLVIGAAIGLLLGLAQKMILRAFLRTSAWWIALTIIGWSLCLLLQSALSALVQIAWGTTYGSGFLGAIGGAIIGIAQWLALRRAFPKAGVWILAHFLSGGAVLGLIPSNLSLFLLPEDWGRLFLIGPVFGLFTGTTLIWLIGQQRPPTTS